MAASQKNNFIGIFTYGQKGERRGYYGKQHLQQMQPDLRRRLAAGLIQVTYGKFVFPIKHYQFRAHCALN
jgi:hypothetical protein